MKLSGSNYILNNVKNDICQSIKKSCSELSLLLYKQIFAKHKIFYGSLIPRQLYKNKQPVEKFKKPRKRSNHGFYTRPRRIHPSDQLIN